MYDKNKLKKLLKNPLNNFSVIIKEYCKSLVQYYRLLQDTISIPNKQATIDKLNIYLEQIENIFRENNTLKPYLNLDAVISENINQYFKTNKTATFETLNKKMIKYVVKNKWSKDVTFVDYGKRIDVFLPSKTVINMFLDDDQTLHISTSTDYDNYDEDKPVTYFGSDPISILSSPHMSPKPITSVTVTTPHSPFPSPLPDPVSMTYDTDFVINMYKKNYTPWAHDSMMKYLYDNPTAHTVPGLKIVYSPYDVYFGLLNYIKTVIFKKYISYFPEMKFLDPYAATYNDLVSMSAYIDARFKEYVFDTRFYTKTHMIKYAMRLYCTLKDELARLNPSKSYDHPAIPIAFALYDSVNYTAKTIKLEQDIYFTTC